MIQVTGLQKNFGPIRAVSDLSFKIEEGEVVALLGPNGAGKSTAMRILTGFLTPDEGQIQIAGIDMIKESTKARSQIGYLPEDVPLYKEMTVDSFIRFMGRLKGLSGSQIRDGLPEVLASCRIENVRNRLVGKLSKGYRQRVGLAQALLGNPKILILDEPTSGLDPRQINDIRGLIRDLKGKQTILISTHILPEANAVADRVLIINNGRLAAEGSPHELAGRMAASSEYQLVLKQNQPEEKWTAFLKGLPQIQLISESFSPELKETTFRVAAAEAAEIRPDLLRSLVKEGADVLELKRSDISLEEIFLRLVTEEPHAKDGAEKEGHSNPDSKTQEVSS